MVLAMGGDIVFDEYNDKFDEEQEPNFEDYMPNVNGLSTDSK